MKQKKLSPKKIIILIAASLAVAMLAVVVAKLLGFDVGGSDSDSSWWFMFGTMS